MYNLQNLWARFIEVKPSNDQLKIIKHQILEIYKIETYWFCQNGSPLVHKQHAVHRRVREKANKSEERCVVSDTIHINLYPFILIQSTIVAFFIVYFHNFVLQYRVIISQYRYLNLWLYSVHVFVFHEWTFFLFQ